MFLSTGLSAEYRMMYEKLRRYSLFIEKCFSFAGVGLCVQPLYLGEVAPKHLRGGMAMGSSIFLTGGILSGQIIGLRLEIHVLFYLTLLVCKELQFPAAS